jgi:hypothetical protein
MKVVVRKAVFRNIDEIAEHIIHTVKMPETALRYADRLIKFGSDLGKYPYAHALCRDLKLAENKFRCAVFDKKWIFVYKVFSTHVVIHRLVWGGQIK